MQTPSPLPKRAPKLLLALPAALLLMLLALYWRSMSLDPNTLPSPVMGKVFPAFALSDLDDPHRIVTEKTLQGPAIVNIWASWCVACREENPLLLALKSEGFRIYGVDYLDRVEDARNWLAKESNPFTAVIFDADGKLGQALGLFGAPETYVIDAQGVIIFRHIGALAPSVVDALKAAMGRGSPRSRQGAPADTLTAKTDVQIGQVGLTPWAVSGNL